MSGRLYEWTSLGVDVQTDTTPHDLSPPQQYPTQGAAIRSFVTVSPPGLAVPRTHPALRPKVARERCPLTPAGSREALSVFKCPMPEV